MRLTLWLATVKTRNGSTKRRLGRREKRRARGAYGAGDGGEVILTVGGGSVIGE